MIFRHLLHLHDRTQIFSKIVSYLCKSITAVYVKAIWSHLVEALLQVWCSHSFSHVSVTGVGQKELPFCCQCSPNVLPAVYIFLTSVHYANITWDRESSNKRWAGWFDNIYHAMIEMWQLKFSNIVYTVTDIYTSMSGYECFMLFTCENNKEPVRNVKIQDMSKTSQDKTKELSNTIEQRYWIPVLAPPRSAYFAYLSLLTHLIQIISLLEVRSMHELCSDWHAPYTGSIAPYSLSRGNPLKFTSFRNIHSWICATQRLHARTSVTSYTSVNI